MKKLIAFFICLVLLTVKSNAHQLIPNQDNSEEDKVQALDLALDIFFIAKGVMHIAATGSGWGALGLDIAGAFIPGVTGMGQARRMAYAASTAKTINRLDNAHKCHTLGKSFHHLNQGKKIDKWNTVRHLQADSRKIHTIINHALKYHKSTAALRVSKTIDGKFAQGLFDTKTQAYALIQKAFNQMKQGKFRTVYPDPPTTNVVMYVDMGKTIGYDAVTGKALSHICIAIKGGKNGAGSIYPCFR